MHEETKKQLHIQSTDYFLTPLKVKVEVEMITACLYKSHKLYDISIPCQTQF